MSEEIVESTNATAEPVEAEIVETPEIENPEPENEPEPEKVPKGVQKRIDEITREKYEERRERQAALARAEKLERELEQLRATQQQRQPEPQAQRNDGPPDPNQYPAGRFDPDYLEALTEFRIEQRFQAQIAQTEQAKQAATIKQKEAEFRAIHPDYDSARDFILSDPILATHPGIGQAVIHSDSPADVIYYLGTHPEEAYQLARLDPFAAAMRIGAISASLKQPAPPVTPAKPVSNAPAPISPISGAGKSSAFPTDPSEARTYAEYVKLREQQIKARAG